MPPKPSQPPATDASPPSADSAAANRVQSTRPPSRTIVAAKESSLFLSIPNTLSKALTIRRRRLAKEMAWWQLELKDWFNAYLPGEDLPDNLQWTPFNVDLTSEETMYVGLRKGLQDAIETVGCHALEARSTHRYPDNTPSSDGMTTRICPDLGIYPTSRPDPDAQQSPTSSVDSTESIRVRFGSMEVPVEVKRLLVKRNAASSAGTSETPPSSSTSNPSTSLPNIASTSWGDVIMLSSEGGYAIPLSLEAHRGQLVEYVIEVFNRQHRLFVFMILFVNDRGRLLRFDRTGVSMTVEFDYTQHPEIIGKFLRRVSGSRAAMGHDPTAAPADAADEKLFRELHTRYMSQSAVGRGLKNAATDGWSVYKLSIEGRFSPDHSTAVLPTAPMSRQEYLICKPMFGNRSLSGRGTKTYIGYDLARDQVVVIKDSWRLNSANVRPEYDTYLLLNEAVRQADSSDKFNAPTLLGGGDVVVAGVEQQTQTSNPDLLTRIHFRLVLKEICRPLEDFASSSELVRVTLAALNAHSFAWVKARILHRDVSIGNILILDPNPEGLPNPQKSKGLLADWDLARTREELENPAFTQRTRSGTWPFISARLQQSGSEQPHELSDDLESFVHVLNYCALKYLPNDLSSEDYRLALFISVVYDHVRQSGGLEKGSRDKLEFLIRNRPFVQLQPHKQPLQCLLEALSELCYEHYHHIQFPPPLHPPDHLRGGTSLEVLEDNFEELGTTLVEKKNRPPPVLAISVDAASEDPPSERLLRTPATIRALPPPDPSKSPFTDHEVMGVCLLDTLRPPDDSHPAYGLSWPVGDKIQRTKPLDITPNVSVSRSSKRESAGFPSYAPFAVADPEYFVPSKRVRTTTSGSRGSGSGTSRKVQQKAPRTSADASRTRSEASPGPGPSRYIDPMALRSDGEPSGSRSTTPESEGRFDDGDDDVDNLEPDTNESDAPAAANNRPTYQYAERITDMAAELDEILFH
ncbi:hypothetical protein GSI_05867 [Ganoderma sinense ZZ0214-1]|uniref:Fungal-type protein kinase domain-containing protein n=1 Tax=Ganoderma sinense ZZ0214-1 TaxID=1077348 RepID=A0A2G8SBN6_9APHY|nr:hypothetical protein GSI_05867 [Ganoderma sinense ZZ0214-1]